MQIQKKFCFTIAYIICLLTAQFNAVNAQDWPTSKPAGNGTENSPWEITSAEQLADLAGYVNTGNGDATFGVHYKLMNDIDFSGYEYPSVKAWKPIGDYSTENTATCFQGNFDGNGKAIQNIKIDRAIDYITYEKIDYIGLFGYIDNATIKNLGVENCHIIGRYYVGGLVGQSDNNSVISNCYATGKVGGGYSYIGGLVGYNKNSTISNSYTSTNVSADNNIGGLVGYVDSGSILNCYTLGDISGYMGIGGLIGHIESGSVSNCYASGDIKGDDNVGGLIGSRRTNTTIQDCVAANNNVVSGNGVRVHPVVGNTGGGTDDKNYFLNTMIVKHLNENVIITNNDGVREDITTFQSLAFYTDTKKWTDGSRWNIGSPASVWKICEDRTLPLLQWQADCSELYIITAASSLGGTITPRRQVVVKQGSSQSFIFKANENYEIDQVLVNGVNNPEAVASQSYTFTDVTAAQTIEVIFKSSYYSGGYGTESEPYQICTPEQLAYLASYVNANNPSTSGIYFKLMNDIDLSGYADGAGWLPIGYMNMNNRNYHFQGNFDGNGKVIRNLTINRPQQDRVGLFGRTYQAKITNLGLENCNIVGQARVGGLAGYHEESNVSQCYVTGSISGTGNNVGGLVGYFGQGSINNCYTAANVNGVLYAGGLAGYQYWGVLSYSYASGNIRGNQYIGGLVGAVSNGKIDYCVAAQDSITAGTNTADVNRILGKSIPFTSFHCYALNTMTVKNSDGNIAIIDSLLWGNAGKDMDMATLQSLSFYSDSENWEAINHETWDMAGIWDIYDGQGLPFFRWQRTSSCHIEAIDVSDIIIPEETGIVVIPDEISARMAWRAVEDAAGYTLTIYSDEDHTDIVCVLEFNAVGKLTDTYFLKSQSPEDIFGIKINNLSENTTYYYQMQITGENETVLDTKESSFTTGEKMTTSIVEINDCSRKIAGYYNILGIKLPQAPEQGMYIILYDNGKAEKVLKYSK